MSSADFGNQTNDIDYWEFGETLIEELFNIHLFWENS